MGHRTPLRAAGDDLQGLRESLHHPHLLASIRAWPWAARGSAELLMLYLAGKKLDDHMYNCVNAVITLGDKREILCIQKALDKRGDLTGLKFTKDQGGQFTVYLVHVGTVHFGDYRDKKYGEERKELGCYKDYIVEVMALAVRNELLEVLIITPSIDDLPVAVILTYIPVAHTLFTDMANPSISLICALKYARPCWGGEDCTCGTKYNLDCDLAVFTMEWEGVCIMCLRGQGL